ncbi:MAG: Flagellar assembly factor FliW [candidate division BRC1 bacterium ADurb.BinA364]|nr:MAG: Flagellar assembly factor FliW [candidate division BRC1 bacterium ADurb.BinA364]
MKIATSRFGTMNIPDNKIINIPEGILGFPNDRRFVILDHDADDTPFKWLQSADSASLAFIVIDPRLMVAGYQLEFDEQSVALFGPIVPSEFIPMVIVNVPQSDPIKMTANLKAPIVVSEEKRLGRQIILSSEEYSIVHRIFPDAPLGGEAEERNEGAAESMG